MNTIAKAKERNMRTWQIFRRGASALILLIAPGLALANGEGFERAPYMWDVWAALGILALFVFCALTLSAHRAATQRYGQIGFGLALVATAGFILIAFTSGVTAEFEETDDIPMLLILMVVSVVAGVYLLVSALREPAADGAPTPDPLPTRNTTELFGRVSRFFHWSIAALIFLLMVIGIIAEGAGGGHAWFDPILVVHKSLGIIVILLVIARIIWLFRSPWPQPASSLKPWEQKLSHAVHGLLYILILLWPISGAIMSAFGGHDVAFFFVDLPQIFPENEAISDFGEWLHKAILPDLFIVLIILHVGGLLKHHFWDKDKGVIRRMAR